MSLREAVRIALRGLRANRLRSTLTMLGIIIGIAAVILLVAIGHGHNPQCTSESNYWTT